MPSEKNQNSSAAQNPCRKAASEKLLKNARVKTHAGGIKKTAIICFKCRTGTTHSTSECVSTPKVSFRLRLLRFAKGFTRQVDQLCAPHVGPGSRINANDLPFLNEQGDLNGLSGFEASGFLHVVCAIAPDPFC
jgi:hypothetical protein